MTIREIEALAEMDRANVRFYEREELIVPRRLENGYRDYSEDDLQSLLRIKLLRSLHIPLDEIKALKNGSRDLAETLSGQIAKLAQERLDLTYAQDVCRAMQEDKAVFAELDARKYLDAINRKVKETGSPYFTVKNDVLPQAFYPWRRYLARTLDLFGYELIWSAFLAFVFHVNLTARTGWGSFIDGIITLVMMLFLEPLFLHLLGTTPGKAIFGFRLETSDGGRLSYGDGFARTWGVIGAGMGYSIPIYNLVRLWKSYKLCRNNETEPWDEEVAYIHKGNKWYRGPLYIGAVAAACVVLAVIMYAQQLAPNRGNLTVAEFVENHNYYAKLLGVNFGNAYLDENGKWAESNSDGTIHIDISYTANPEYHFILENGNVTGISFSVDIKNSENWLGSYNKYMLLSSLAFAGAQRETGLFSKTPGRIEKEIGKNTFEDFSFTEAGITFACDTEYSGYINAHSNSRPIIGLLIPEENAAESYFSLNFSMNMQGRPL